MSTLCAYENYLRDRYVLGQSVHYAAGSSSPKPKSYDREGNEYTWSDEAGDYVRQVGGPGGGRTIRLSEVEKAQSEQAASATPQTGQVADNRQSAQRPAQEKPSRRPVKKTWNLTEIEDANGDFLDVQVKASSEDEAKQIVADALKIQRDTRKKAGGGYSWELQEILEWGERNPEKFKQAIEDAKPQVEQPQAAQKTESSAQPKEAKARQPKRGARKKEKLNTERKITFDYDVAYEDLLKKHYPDGGQLEASDRGFFPSHSDHTITLPDIAKAIEANDLLFFDRVPKDEAFADYDTVVLQDRYGEKRKFTAPEFFNFVRECLEDTNGEDPYNPSENNVDDGIWSYKPLKAPKEIKLAFNRDNKTRKANRNVAEAIGVLGDIEVYLQDDLSEAYGVPEPLNVGIIDCFLGVEKSVPYYDDGLGAKKTFVSRVECLQAGISTALLVDQDDEIPAEEFVVDLAKDFLEAALSDNPTKQLNTLYEKSKSFGIFPAFGIDLYNSMPTPADYREPKRPVEEALAEPPAQEPEPKDVIAREVSQTSNQESAEVSEVPKRQATGKKQKAKKDAVHLKPLGEVVTWDINTSLPDASRSYRQGDPGRSVSFPEIFQAIATNDLGFFGGNPRIDDDSEKITYREKFSDETKKVTPLELYEFIKNELIKKTGDDLYAFTPGYSSGFSEVFNPELKLLPREYRYAVDYNSANAKATREAADAVHLLNIFQTEIDNPDLPEDIGDALASYAHKVAETLPDAYDGSKEKRLFSTRVKSLAGACSLAYLAGETKNKDVSSKALQLAQKYLDASVSDSPGRRLAYADRQADKLGFKVLSVIDTYTGLAAPAEYVGQSRRAEASEAPRGVTAGEPEAIAPSAVEKPQAQLTPPESGAQFDDSGLGLPGKSDAALKPGVAENKDAAYFVRRDLETTPKSETEEMVEEVDEASDAPSSDAPQRDDDAALERKVKEALDQGEPLRKKATRLRSKAKDAALKGRKEEAAELRKQADEIEAEAHKYIDEATNAGVELKNRRAKASQQPAPETKEPVEKPEVSNSSIPEQQPEPVAESTQESPAKPRPERWTPLKSKMNDDDKRVVENTRKRLNYGLSELAWRLGNAKEKGDVQRVKQLVATAANHYLEQARRAYRSHGGTEALAAFDEALGGDGLTVGQLRDRVVDKFRKIAQMEANDLFKFAGERLDEFESFAEADSEPISNKEIHLNSIRDKSGKWEDLDDKDSELAVEDAKPSTLFPDEYFGRRMGSERGLADAVRRALKSMTRKGEYRDSFENSAEYAVPEYNIDTPTRMGRFLAHGYKDTLDGEPVSRDDYSEQRYQELLKKFPTDRESRKLNNLFKSNNREVNKLIKENEDEYKKSENKSEVVQRVVDGIRGILSGGRQNGSVEAPPSESLRNGTTGEVLETGGADRPSDGGDGRNLASVSPGKKSKEPSLSSRLENVFRRFIDDSKVNRVIGDMIVKRKDKSAKNGLVDRQELGDPDFGFNEELPKEIEDSYASFKQAERDYQNAPRYSSRSSQKIKKAFNDARRNYDKARQEFLASVRLHIDELIAQHQSQKNASVIAEEAKKSDIPESRVREELDAPRQPKTSPDSQKAVQSLRNLIQRVYNHDGLAERIKSQATGVFSDALSAPGETGFESTGEHDKHLFALADKLDKAKKKLEKAQERFDEKPDSEKLERAVDKAEDAANKIEDRLAQAVDKFIQLHGGKPKGKRSAPVDKKETPALASTSQKSKETGWKEALESQEELKPVSKGKYNPHAKPYSWKEDYPETEDELRAYVQKHIDGGDVEEFTLGSDGKKVTIGEHSGDEPMTLDEMRRFVQLRWGREFRKSLEQDEDSTKKENFTKKELEKLQEPGEKRGQGRPTKKTAGTTQKDSEPAQRPDSLEEFSKPRIDDELLDKKVLELNTPRRPARQKPQGSGWTTIHVDLPDDDDDDEELSSNKAPSPSEEVAREAQKSEVPKEQVQEKIVEAVSESPNARKPQAPSLQEPGGRNAADSQALPELKQQDAGAEPLGEDVVQDRIAEAVAGGGTSKRKRNLQRSTKPQDDSLLGNKREDSISDEEARRRIAKDNLDSFVSAFDGIPKKAPSYWLARRISNEINDRMSFGGYTKTSVRKILEKLNEELRKQEFYSTGPSRLDSAAKDLAARLGIERGTSLDYFNDLITDLDRAWLRTDPENIGLHDITSYQNGTYTSPISPQKKVNRSSSRSSKKTFTPDSVKDDVEKAVQIRNADRTQLSGESIDSMMNIAQDVSKKYGVDGLKHFMRNIDAQPTAGSRPKLLKELRRFLEDVAVNRAKAMEINRLNNYQR